MTCCSLRSLLIVAAALVSVVHGQPPTRPNILLILADDLGYSDLGCYGSEIRTPNLDSLAQGGLRYTQMYNCTRCCPSRASLLTGLYPHQAGIGAMTGDQGQLGYRGSLQPNCVTFAQVLKTAGYRTAMVGKWHVGDNILPIERGFENFYGFTRGYGVNSWYPKMMVRLPEGKTQRKYAPGEYFATDALTDHALDFLGEMRDGKSPWLMYVAYQAPHFPLQARPEDIGQYWRQYEVGWDRVREGRITRQKQLGLLPESPTLTPRSPIPLPSAAQRVGSATTDGNNPAWESLPEARRSDLAHRMAIYSAMVTVMDRNIGRLIDDIKSRGELENTLIVFLSDNGACAEWEPFGFDLQPIAGGGVQQGVGINIGTQGASNYLWKTKTMGIMSSADGMISYGSGWANASNTPWRLYKHACHEGGISGPFIAHWPARIKNGGQIRQQVGHLMDLMPTFVDVAGATYPAEVAGQKIDPPEGKSIVPSFDDQPIGHETLAWEHEGNAAIRAGDWKLVRHGQDPWELYNIAEDRTELNDLAGQNKERVQALAAQWQTWAERTHVFPKPGGGNAGKQKKAK